MCLYNLYGGYFLVSKLREKGVLLVRLSGSYLASELVKDVLVEKDSHTGDNSSRVYCLPGTQRK